jgi:hypothetical protein
MALCELQELLMMTSPLLMSGPAESIEGRGDGERALSIHYKEKERDPDRDEGRGGEMRDRAVW